MITKIVVIALYALMVVTVGIIGLLRTKSSKDFLLGGGNVGPWMSAFSYGTAYFSAVLFIGFAGKIGWGFGFSGLWIAVFNAALGVFAVWLLLGWKIKQASIRYNVTTMSEFLEKRYKSSIFKLISAIVIFIFLIPYSAAVFMGLSYLFEISLGVPYVWVLVAMGVFTASYIVLGGYKSMAMIDMIFGLIMTVSVLLLLYFTLDKGDGFVNMTDSLRIMEPKLVSWIGPPGWWPLFALVFLTSIAPFAMPQLVAKFYAIRDKRAVRIGAIASTFFAVIIGGIAYFMGSTTRYFISPDSAPAIFKEMDGRLIPDFDKLMPELLTNVMPASLSVIILLLILSASMSTLASLVLISSSSFTKDFWVGFVNHKMSDKNVTMMMRVTSAFFVLLAVIFAAFEFDVIVEILGISWGAIGSFFLGPFVWGLLSRKVNKTGAYISGIGGLGICLGLYFFGMPSPEAGTIGMGASLLLNPLFSLFGSRDPEKAKDHDLSVFIH